MINNIIKWDVLENRQKELGGILNTPEFQSLTQEAKKRWIKYQPSRQVQCTTVGIDGSFGEKPYQGIVLYLVAAAAVDSTNRLVPVGRSNSGLIWQRGIRQAKKGIYSGSMNSLELQLTEQVLNNPDFQGPVLVLVDASLEAWSIRLGKQLGEFFKRTFVEKSNDKKLIFISKNPESTSQFNGSAADVFYFNNIPSPNRAAGFSLPIEDRNYYNRFGAGIVEFYARLSNDTPIIKIEFANLADSALSPEQLDNLRQHEIPKLLDMLAYDSRSGYPHSLRLAHDNVAITPEDMDAIARYYDGLRGQVGARDALHQQHHGTIRKNTGGDF